MSIKKRMQLVENGVAQDIDILTSAECVTFEDGDTLQAKLDNGDLASSDVLGDVDSLDGSVVDSLNELNDSAKETSELISELANRGGVTSALRKEVASGWSSVGNLPYYFRYGCVIVFDNKIHLLGGNYNNTYYSYHYYFDGSSWVVSTGTPYKFYYGSAVVYENELHILGGTANKTAHYKLNSSSWESVSTLPYEFSNGGSVVLNNEIHIFGSNNSSYRKYHYKYNGSNWESVTTLPINFYRGKAVVLDNEIHILNSNTIHYKYNGTTWESVSTLPYNFDNSSSVVYHNEIHLLGGDYTTTTMTYHYKWNGTSWESVSTLPKGFLGNNGAIVLDNEIQILFYGDDVGHVHYKASFGTTFSGYSKADTDIYLPISTTPITSNLVATEDGYTVTEDGYVEILLNE